MRILIVEDEPHAAEMLKEIILSYFKSKIEKISVVKSLAAGQCHVLDEEIDLMLLDLNLNGEDGFNILKESIAASFQTIIVSAHTEKAAEAFEYGVLDFVPKPYSEERLRQALKKFKEQFMNNDQLKYLAVRKKESIELVSLEDIIYIETNERKSDIFLVNNDKKSSAKSISALETILPKNFFRSHKSYILNLDYVKECKSYGGGKYSIIFKNGKSLPLSRKLYEDLKSRLNII